MDEKYLDTAMDAANQAAAKAREYKSETFFAVLLSTLLDKGGRTLSLAPVEPLTVAEHTRLALPKPLAPGEFFAARAWDTEVDKVVLAGYFLERHSSLERYTANELRGCLIGAKVPPPKNIHLAIFQAVRRGWIMEATQESNESKAWSLTQSGEKRAQEMGTAGQKLTNS